MRCEHCGQELVEVDNPFRRELEAEHDRLMNERARLILDGVDPRDLDMPQR